MASRKYQPNISKTDFDRAAPKLRAALKRKYDEAKDDGAKPPLRASTKGAFDHVPDLDSKTVAKWSATVKKILGCDLDPKLIKRGGYESFDEFWKDISVKLRDSCPASVSAGTAAPSSSASAGAGARP
jgi:hypothetical protein